MNSSLPIKLRMQQRGVSLLEVMIAVVILSFGLLGLASLQMATLRNNQSAFDSSRAIMSIYSILDIMRADVRNQEALNPGNPFPQGRLADWQNNLKTHLGDEATGSILCNSVSNTPVIGPAFFTTQCTVTVTWNDAKGINGQTARSITTQVQL